MRLILSLLFLFINNTHADNEFIVGGVTAHFTNIDQVDRQFTNKLNASGEVILNPTMAVRHYDYDDGVYVSKGAFIGGNSIGQPMAGVIFSGGGMLHEDRAGLAAGMYVQDNNKFRDRGVEPVSYAEARGMGFVPLVGVEYIHACSRNTLLNVLITPILGNIGLGWRF